MIVKPDPGLPESQTPDSISIVVSLDAAHSMIALPVEAPLSHVRKMRQEGHVAMKNGAMQRARGICGNVKALRGAPCALVADGGRR